MKGRAGDAAKPPLLAALTDGEDFELLFTVAARNAVPVLDGWKARFPETPLTCIGRIMDRPGLRLRGINGVKRSARPWIRSFRVAQPTPWPLVRDWARWPRRAGCSGSRETWVPARPNWSRESPNRSASRRGSSLRPLRWLTSTGAAGFPCFTSTFIASRSTAQIIGAGLEDHLFSGEGLTSNT